jgi:pimeloyl-ACP methyl ester carboxylesterase
MLMVPGVGLGAEAWLPTVEALGNTGQLNPVLMRTVPLPGYGLPASAREPLAPSALAGRLVDQMPEGPVLLMGHSAGCQVVANAARQAPDRVVALVLVGPTTDPRGASWARLVGRWPATASHEPRWQVPLLVRQYRRTGLTTMAPCHGGGPQRSTHGGLVAGAILDFLHALRTDRPSG